MIPVSDILTNRVCQVLNDTSNTRWTLPELFAWVNEAALAVINRRPEAGIRRTVTQSLKAGTYQLLPDEAIELIDITRNINADGSPGRSIRLADRQLLDDSDPMWHAGTQSGSIKRYCWDKRAPKVFYVYPPAKAGTTIELIQAELPDQVTDLTQQLEMDYEYIEPIVSFVLYRCLSKEFEYANGAVAAAHYQAFNDALGITNTSNDAMAPTGPGPGSSV